ncbi:MAG: hypothetical protein WBB85_09935 [Albidovulum sp.]|uniref:hypothetical protein n=1 Tax=Albidovulum sp. TaxID=1872424 RepID=UPI003CB61401
MSIDGQLGHFFADAKDAAAECAHGQVSTVVQPSNDAKPYLICTKLLDLPKVLDDWEEGSEEPLELAQ